MKIVIFGAGGMIGSRLTAEALRRGHAVTAVQRHLAAAPPGATAVQGDALDAASVAGAVAGHDAVVNAIGPGQEGAAAMLVDAARSLPAGLRQAGVRRLLVVGGAGSLEVAPGLQLVDAPGFPAAWLPPARAHRDALAVYRAVADLDWTYVSPAAHILPGERTGKYRIGFDQLLVGADGESRISAEDYAVALLDEIEHPAHVRRRITIAY